MTEKRELYQVLPGEINISVLGYNEKCASTVWISYASEQADDFLNNPNITEISCTIDYPLDNPYTFKLKKDPNNGYWAVMDLVLGVCKGYKKVYKNPDKYGIWGHDIGDLVIEYMSLDPKKKELVIGIGS